MAGAVQRIGGRPVDARGAPRPVPVVADRGLHRAGGGAELIRVIQ
jgi:hypothetical protein